MTLRAFFDEGGLHGDAVLTGVAGFLAPSASWIELEAKWSALLIRLSDVTKRPFKIFHAVHCENGAEEWQGIQREIREAFYLSFARIICEQDGLRGVAISVVLEDWERLATPELLARMGSPYKLCAEHCFQQIGYWSRRGLEVTPVAVVFSENQRLSRCAADIFGYYIQAKPWAHLQSLTFASPMDNLPLQCADLLSYESYLYWLKIENDGLKFGLERPAMDMLRQARRLENSACYDGLALRNAIRRFHHDKGLADPFPV